MRRWRICFTEQRTGCANVKRERAFTPQSPFVILTSLFFVVLQTDPLTRSRALDLIADRLRDAFGEALQALYVLPDNPYEPAGDDEWIVLAAVLDDSYHEQKGASQQAARIGCSFEKEVDWRYVVTVFTMSATEREKGATEVARVARSGGVRL